MVTNIESFKFWAHKVMPLVYDDSLSYYEFMCKVLKKLNEIIDNTAAQNEVIVATDTLLRDFTETMYPQYKTQLEQAIADWEQQSTTTINTWMNTIQTENIPNTILINFQEWLNDGTWKTLFDEQVVADQNAKIAAVTSGSPSGVFATLTALQGDVVANTSEGKKRIYVVSADGKWYYWDGTAWADGGIYQSTSFDGVFTIENQTWEVI